MTHLEAIIAEYLAWRGFFVRTNVIVGKRTKGGHKGELDVVAFLPTTPQRLIHVEASLAAGKRKEIIQRLSRQLETGRNYITSSVFPWIGEEEVRLEQFVVVPSVPTESQPLGDAVVISVDALFAEICQCLAVRGAGSRAAIPQKYPLLRTIQLATVGYQRTVSPSEPFLISPGEHGATQDQ